ncbi:carbohydrate kinase [Brevibacterium sp. 5221]|uniref:Carbohydrate kinase n=1 Tax=Brevibacterium rongguiense TaxID=2695267 RepID=A0A6N9H4B2_9MICO|nr:PfkB family carbohydrate kinase [Brevibacterium rongguiense]MYM18775.1 carbohydrate kinase [Brevibacterium rongguiense]
MDPRFLVIGEALIDIVETADGARAEHPGGSPANVALGLGRLGHRVELACALGADVRAERIAAHLAASGVGLGASLGAIARTSTAHARLNAAGAADYAFDLEWRFDAVAAPAADHLHTGSLAAQLAPGADAVLALLRARRDAASISFDPNIRPDLLADRAAARARCEEIVALADVVKASDEDLAHLYPGVPVDRALADWAGRGPVLAIATLGARGALACLPGGEPTALPARPVAVADTVGAGDSFMAGLLSGLADAGLLGVGGGGLRKPAGASAAGAFTAALGRATVCAALTVARAGADLPTRSQLPG